MSSICQCAFRGGSLCGCEREERCALLAKATSIGERGTRRAPSRGGRLHYRGPHFHLIGRQSGQGLARVLEARLISDSIAAFHNDNIKRVKYLNTNPLTSKVMLGIVMDGSMPTPYKIPITAELVRAVESGEQPEEETVVHAYVPEVPRPEEGMKPLDNRHIILSCFEAFRKFL